MNTTGSTALHTLVSLNNTSPKIVLQGQISVLFRSRQSNKQHRARPSLLCRALSLTSSPYPQHGKSSNLPLVCRVSQENRTARYVGTLWSSAANMPHIHTHPTNLFFFLFLFVSSFFFLPSTGLPVEEYHICRRLRARVPGHLSSKPLPLRSLRSARAVEMCRGKMWRAKGPCVGIPSTKSCQGSMHAYMDTKGEKSF